MFDGFPYTNFHELNLDWIIKIAKDFLDQYTHIQEVIEDGNQSLNDTITNGLNELDEKATVITNLLNEWYNTHSADIADQLASALADLNAWYTQHQNYLDQTLADKTAAFNSAADAKAAATIASIPDDYSTLSGQVNKYRPKFVYGETPAAPYNDFDTFPVNESIIVFANTVTSHSPESDALLMVETVAAGSNIKKQIAFPMKAVNLDPQVISEYIRYNYGSGWSTWQKNLNDIMTLHGVGIGYGPGITPDAPYDDANTFPENTIVLAYKNRNVAHLPLPTGNVYNIVTLNGVTGQTGSWQLAVDIQTNAVYTRTKLNSWGDWRELGAGGGSSIITVNPSDNLVDILAAAYTAGNTTVIVNGGTHNMLTEYGITNDRTDFPGNFDYYGAKIGNNCRIIGINGAKLTGIYSGTVDAVKSMFSILNVISSCEIIGLDFEATNIRYCIHDDPNNIYHDNRPGYRVLYEDCYMVHNGSNGSYSVPACIGAGTTQMSEHILNRCSFTSPAAFQLAVSYHNNSGSDEAKLTVTNCVFGAGNTLQLYALAETGSYVRCIICGNKIPVSMIITPSGNNRFIVSQFNNVQ